MMLYIAGHEAKWMHGCMQGQPFRGDSSLQAPAKTKVIDASGKYVMPGGIDPHVHLEAPMFGMISIDTFYRHALGLYSTINLYVMSAKGLPHDGGS